MKRIIQVFIGSEWVDSSLEHEIEQELRTIGAGFYPKVIKDAHTHRVYRKARPGMKGQLTELLFEEATEVQKPDYMKTQGELNAEAGVQPKVGDD